MEMEGRGATNQARGSSASGEVSGEPVLAGEDEGASVKRRYLVRVVWFKTSLRGVVYVV
jgi:hypothetical protein